MIHTTVRILQLLSILGCGSSVCITVMFTFGMMSKQTGDPGVTRWNVSG